MFWSSISLVEQRTVESAGTRRRYAKGDLLFLENEPSTHVMVILGGGVKLSRASIDGREVIIELRGPGQLVGELAAIDYARRIATATAMNVTDVIVISAPAFRRLLLEQPGVMMAVLTLVAKKLRQSTERRLAAGTSDATARLAGRLVELAGDAPNVDGGVIEIDSVLTQQEMAEWLGVSRDAVVLALRSMRVKGWIETGRRNVRIHDLAALQEISGL